MLRIIGALLLLLGLAVGAQAQNGPGGVPNASGSFQNGAGASGSIETLPGGFRRFRDSSGNTGILQRTPDSGFPNTQFIAPVPPVFPSSIIPSRDQAVPNAGAPSTRLPQNLLVIPGTQIPLSSGQNR